MSHTRSIFKMLMCNSGRESETGSLTVSDGDYATTTARVLFCEDGWAVLRKLHFSTGVQGQPAGKVSQRAGSMLCSEPSSDLHGCALTQGLLCEFVLWATQLPSCEVQLCFLEKRSSQQGLLTVCSPFGRVGGFETLT